MSQGATLTAAAARVVRDKETVGARRALGAALRDTYRNSWRLLILNSALSAAALAILLAATYATPALLLLILLGPLAAALAHCAVVCASTEEMRVADAADGLRLHWRRGLVLGLGVLAVVPLGIYAIAFYGAAQRTWPLAFLAAYLLVAFALFQLLVWPLAVAEPDRPLREILAEAFAVLLRRPGSAIGLGTALLLVNLLGAIAVLPFLTLTIAYSMLAAAHFVLPRPTPGGDRWPE